MYNKALMALLTAALQLLALFGIEASEGVRTVLTTLIPLAGTALVYLVPNKPAGG